MSVRKWLESVIRVSTSWIPGVGTAVDEGLKHQEDHRKAKGDLATLLDIEDRRWTPDSSPAALLRADFGVVPFHGRKQELTKLHEWCLGAGESRRDRSGQVPHVALRLYTAPGGYGKTRLLRHFARQRRGHGWEAGFLGESKLAEVGRAEGMNGGMAALFGDSTKSLLLVLDYAESRSAEVTALITAARSSRRHKVRLVLLARSDGDWWNQLQRAGDGVGDFFQGPAVEGPLPLAPLTDSPDTRQKVFEEALEAFAKELGEPVPAASLPEDGEDFDRVLMIHAAALAVVEGEAVPSGGLLTWLLSREERGLERVREKHSGLGRDLQPAMAQAAALLTLAQGADSRAETMEILARVPDLADQSRSRRRQVAEALHVLYRGRRWCDGVEPDLVGEHLVRRELEATPALLGATFGEEVPEARLESGLLVLNRLAQRQSEARDLLVDALRERLPWLALPAVRTALANGDPVGQVLAEVLEEEGDIEVAAQLEGHMPYPSLALRETSAVVDRLLLARLRRQIGEEPSEEEQKELAQRANDLSLRLAALGRREESFAAIEESVEIHRRLASSRPDAFLPDLAKSLNNLSIRLAALGRREAGLSAIEESVEIRRRLAGSRPDAFLPGLAKSLNNLSLRLADLGRRESGLAAVEESVKIRRRLAGSRPDAFLPNLARSLSVLHDRLVEADQPAAALAAIREALDLLEPFFRRHPAAFAPLMSAIIQDTEQTSKACGESIDHPRLESIREILQQLESREHPQ